MFEDIVRFSRLLRIFELNCNPAFIIELKENNKKSLYISYKVANRHYFKLYKDTKLKKEFENLSTHCLMNQCKDATGMFAHSPLTHFEADCSSLVYGISMFSSSSLKSIKTEFPLLEDGRWMFKNTKIKTMTINFPKLKRGWLMFSNSSLKKTTSQFPMLEDGESMFEHTPLKEINCQFPKLENETGMFDGTPPELKQNYPYYFA